MLTLPRHKKMKVQHKVVLMAIVVLGVVLAAAFLLYGNNFAVLNTKGQIAHEQRTLLIFATLLSLVVVLPVFVMTFYIAWKYRASNTKARYAPNWDHNRSVEAVWWGVPLILIIILSIVTWVSSHRLDPFRPIVSDRKPLHIQAVALQWKWLFIYPEQHIASLNYVQFPEDTPVRFEITADAPMNSFWIPQLGGQVYAMSGMSTQLNLIADEAGRYNGSSANISGEGFASMRFVAESTKQADFDAWVQTAQLAPKQLTLDAYTELVRPSEGDAPAVYALARPDLYHDIMSKFMAPGAHRSQPSHSHGGAQ